jgi:transposase-like protein
MNTYKRHRFPPDIISYAVWLYYRFKFSHRDIEDLLAERGLTVSREAIRPSGGQWIRTAKWLMFSCRRDAMVRQQSDSLSGYCDRMEVNPGRL